jgi:dienelactone hydrolase
MASPTHRDGDLLRRWGERIKRVRRAITPGRRAWRGAVWGALVALTAILLVTAYGLFGAAPAAWLLAGTPLFLAAFLLAGALLTLLWALLRSLPVPYVWGLASGLLTLATIALTAMSVSIGVFVVGLGAMAVASLLGAGVAVLTGGGWRAAPPARRAVILAGLVLGLVGLIGGGAWLLDAGSPLTAPPNAAALSATPVDPLDLPNPAAVGPYPVRTLSYGSGTDRYRPEYGEGADLVTQPVDGAALIERWSDLRTAYWGFGPQALPLNGQIWYPEGEDGPFPLVLIVHGQHPMHEPSDPGYAYLGELLASRGFIVASIDENFLNLSPLVDLLMVQSLIGADDLRGWLLLEHLAVWRDWNAEPGNPFHRRVDLDHVALIGHSRGGQAVAAAALLNELPRYPDDATVRLNYDFNIRALVAIAPVDGGYRPAKRTLALDDLSYLVLHGSHDMDVFTFQGDRQYSRVTFSDDGAGFKSAIYIYGANHGQFNTRWGRKDLFEPVMRLFNLEQLLPAEAQRQVAEVTISAFLEATLHGEDGYEALFRDLRRGRAWLPETISLHQYQAADTRLVGTYEEDVDPTTTTLPGGQVTGRHLTVWRERPAAAKWEDMGDQTVYLGWDREATSATASYAIDLPTRGLTLTAASTLVFALADANEDPTPNVESTETEDTVEPIDLTVAVVDRAGEVARLPLSHFSLLQPQLEAQLGKAPFMSPFPPSEVVLQHFEFPLADFAAANPALDPASLAQVRLVFDRTAAGVIVLDNVGFRH